MTTSSIDLNNIFADSELGRGFGSLFSSVGNSMFDNLLKGQTSIQGLLQDAANSIMGSAVGIASRGIGQGINALGGDSHLSRGIGQGVSTGLGIVGGQMGQNLLTKGVNIFGKYTNDAGNRVGSLFKVGGANGKNPFKSVEGTVNPYALGAQVLGSALGAATGPSKEYGGRYGNITRTMDTVYDAVMTGVNFTGIGQGISGVMALNKGLSNIFGSTDAMTKQDAILGSAFMPAFVKWLNMAGASKTGTFNNLSWLKSEKTNAFMQNAFGNLGDKFDKAREEAGKTYGTFSQGTKRRSQENIDFANYAWDKVLSMANLNELLNIRSQYMSSINNLRYAQQIQGGWSPLARGKMGMKILNNATDHNIGMRLLSGAALIDNKQMILCSVQD